MLRMLDREKRPLLRAPANPTFRWTCNRYNSTLQYRAFAREREREREKKRAFPISTSLCLFLFLSLYPGVLSLQLRASIDILPQTYYMGLDSWGGENEIEKVILPKNPHFLIYLRHFFCFFNSSLFKRKQWTRSYSSDKLEKSERKEFFQIFYNYANRKQEGSS